MQQGELVGRLKDCYLFLQFINEKKEENLSEFFKN
jgi:hypothetical protein